MRRGRPQKNKSNIYKKIASYRNGYVIGSIHTYASMYSDVWGICAVRRVILWIILEGESEEGCYETSTEACNIYDVV
jgi:hypothetical protein